jgi:hypothetical protein
LVLQRGGSGRLDIFVSGLLAIPEPTTLPLLALGMLLARRRR